VFYASWVWVWCNVVFCVCDGLFVFGSLTCVVVDVLIVLRILLFLLDLFICLSGVSLFGLFCFNWFELVVFCVSLAIF